MTSLPHNQSNIFWCLCVVQGQPGESQAESGECQQGACQRSKGSATSEDGVWTQEEKSRGSAAGVHDQSYRGRKSQGRALGPFT